MRPIPIRTLVSALGLFVSAMTAVSLPIGYFVISYGNTANQLDLTSDARRVANYVHTHDAHWLWQHQPGRLSDLLKPSQVDADSWHKRAANADGMPVLGEAAQLPSPVIARSSPIMLAGTEVGRVEPTTSLQALLGETALLAIVSSLLGFGMFIAFRSLPRQVPDQTLNTLANANGQFIAALNYMSQGLLLFGPDKRILVVNRKYIEMYGLSPEVVKPGCTVNELIQHRKDTGSFFGDVNQYCADIDAAIAQDKVTSSIIETTDGRFIHLVNQPMPDGGWVATHEDITERHNLLRAHDNAERLLREQKLKLDAALNNMVHGLCMFDEQGRVILFNERYRELMGLPAELAAGPLPAGHHATPQVSQQFDARSRAVFCVAARVGASGSNHDKNHGDHARTVVARRGSPHAERRMGGDVRRHHRATTARSRNAIATGNSWIRSSRMFRRPSS